MTALDEAVPELADMIWVSLVGHGPVAVERASDLAPCAAFVTASVRISGAVALVVTVGSSLAGARRIAASMFRRDPAATSVDDARDAMAEAANMFGGNLKALLPSPARLSLPVVDAPRPSAFSDEVPGERRWFFACEGEPILVALRDE